ncbi:MAG: histidine kinase dimerization/phospho-acceptor domain-containing protein, partial [Gallionella sp.]|nr:histidine kinase dimerization/phospho-acceptor domain-containing protein [Gallionella sp.]
MDGFKKRLNESIQIKLSFSLSLAILVIAVIAGGLSFVLAFDEAHELQDDTLQQIAALVDRQQLSLTNFSDVVRSNESDEASSVIIQYLADGKNTVGKWDAGMPLQLPNTLPDGMHTLDVGSKPFRVLVKTTANGNRIVVAQETAIRDEIASESALRTLLPFLILFPILLLIVADIVRKMFRLLTALANEIDQRAEQALHPIEHRQLPTEVRPFVVAINRLLIRVAQTIDAQRRFVADAAHELRSPLTAISLQAERLAEAEMSSMARERLATLQRGIERGRNLLDQLLTLVKIQSLPNLHNLPVSVQGIYRRVLEDLMTLADAKHIDIGVEGEQDAWVLADELGMKTVVKNLLDNAIRYTPRGGRIDMSVSVVQGRAL